ncbi:MAG: hypothetical protein ABIJ47_03610 [Candidatus Bathyarchaeota archaeon]
MNSLSSFDITIRVKALEKGDYTLKPQITFLDDTGVSRNVMINPASINVYEMGILGWLRGALPS